MTRWLAVAWVIVAVAGCKKDCYDCGGPMTAPNPWDCMYRDKTPLTCAEGRDGCETSVTQKHACIPTGGKAGESCSADLLTCPEGQVDACKNFIALRHLCVVIPPWLDPATGQAKPTQP
jgi:hypothetical protein